MSRVPVTALPAAPFDAIANAQLLVVDENGSPLAAKVADLGGARLVAFTDNTPVARFRLISNGQDVEGAAVKATLDALDPITVNTDANGSCIYDFTTKAARGVSHVLTVEVASFLKVQIPNWFWAPLSVATVAPSLSGGAYVGDTITIDKGTWSNTPTEYRYRYLRGAYVIPGAINSGYVLQPEDAQDIITAQVKAINAGGESAWATAGTIGPVSARPTAVTRAPVISGNAGLGSRHVISDFGAASEFAKVQSIEWEADQGPIQAQRQFVKRVFRTGNFTVGVPANLPNAPTSDNGYVVLDPASYTGTNFLSYSVAASAIENDYFFTPTGEPGAAAGNNGPQLWEWVVRHRSTNSAIRAQYFIARIDSAGNVIGTEQPMSRVGAASGLETAEFQPAANTTYTMQCLYDFGQWNAGDRVRIRQRLRNTSSSAANAAQLEVANNATYLNVPMGPLLSAPVSQSAFTPTTKLKTKKLRVKITYANENYSVVGYSNEITLQNEVAQSAAPAVITPPVLFPSAKRQGTRLYVDLGAWSNQPDIISVQWTRDGVDIAGEQGAYILLSAADVGHVITARVTAQNEAGSTNYTVTGITCAPPATYYNISIGNEANDGLDTTAPKQTLASSASLVAYATAFLAADMTWNDKLRIGSNITYDMYGTGSKPQIGGVGILYGIDAYTDDGSINKNNVTVRNLRITGDQRGAQVRQGGNWKFDGCVFDDIGWRAAANQLNNSQGIFGNNFTGLEITNCYFDMVYSDAVYLDYVHDVRILDNTFLPVFGGDADSIQTRQDRGKTTQKGIEIARNLLDMHSRKTSSGKGCIVLNVQDYAWVHDNTLYGNNFGQGSDQGWHFVVNRNVMKYARKNSYSWLTGVGGYDNQLYAWNHFRYDNWIEDAVRGHTYTGIPVSNYTGAKASRADMYVFDDTIVNCTVGINIDRPTSGLFRGIVFHNVGTPLRRMNTDAVPEGNLHTLTSDSHYVYNGAVAKPPEVVTRGAVSGQRKVGEVLTSSQPVFDTAAVLALFPSAVITRSRQWRRHKPMPSPGAGFKLPFYGRDVAWIDGATGTTYTQTADDVDAVISCVERIHLTFTEAGVQKTVTALAYDGSYAADPVTVA